MSHWWWPLSDKSLPNISLTAKAAFAPFFNFIGGTHIYVSWKQGKSEGFDSCDRPSNLAQIWSNHRFFSPCDLEIWCIISKKNKGTSFILQQALCIISNPSVNWNWSYSPETLNYGQNGRFFVLCDLGILWMTLENNRAPLLYYIELCASFQIHQWIQIGVTVRKRSIWVKIGIFCPVWPWNVTDDLE